jgi:hypothetical protein
MMNLMWADIVRTSYMSFAAYGLFLLFFRWRAYTVMTQERRFLFLFMCLEQITVLISGGLKFYNNLPADVSLFLTLLLQAFLVAYLHYSVPPGHRHPLERWWSQRKQRVR